jgi:hypothetical protein
MIRITGIGDHDRPEWLIRINGTRRLLHEEHGVVFHREDTVVGFEGQRTAL